MKVLDLHCSLGHSFEGWFGSQGDYDSQRARGLVTCPVCSDCDITRKLSAPRLNLRYSASPRSQDPSSAQACEPLTAQAPDTDAPLAPTAAPSHAQKGPDALAHMQAALMQAVRHVMANTEDVGTRFANEARKIHYGESEERSIRGQATREETEALLDEGIDVLALPVPDSLKGPLH